MQNPAKETLEKKLQNNYDDSSDEEDNYKKSAKTFFDSLIERNPNISLEKIGSCIYS